MAWTRVGRLWTWRWRRNPLRRRSDLGEAWIVLAAWLIALAGSLLAGLTTADAVHRNLDQQRTERHPITAVLTERAADRTSAQAVDDSHVWAAVRWTSPGGLTHTGRTKVRPGTPTGTPVTIWVDRQGRPVSKPLVPGKAEFQADWTGALAAVGAVGVVFGGAQLARAGLERRRLKDWEEEWARVDTRWGGKTG
ncbi:hypothetical protein OOK58_09455 [Streptomyces sp. NBC_01728]|uniref:Rv1733c family protein n=1 Tax=unclassified Streptomyces TaxID=2593676 RepID=UPI0022597A5B|nr:MULTISPECIES: hypothetical protein [unclassified Streptomyces]MCX4452338.1 hypothetical protein [Streptomyces sp. NBC_01719]MCX4491698.1 hypothetical protein [Streptomyces sp. NBC_01728]